MPIKKKTKTTDTNAIKAVLNAQLQVNAREQDIVDLKRQLLFEKNEHNTLKQRLINFLDPEQIEAAGIAGCKPEVYALEWIDICKDRVRELTPAFMGNILNLVQLKQGNY